MYWLVDQLVKILKYVVPEFVVEPLRPMYHGFLAWLFAHWYGMPARRLTVIGVTGTKGKSTTCDMLYAVLTAAQHKTVLVSTIRYVTPRSEEPNRFKMTMQGRGHLQHLLARGLREGATHAVVELSSEGTLQSRHRFVYLDALIVTNIHPEHIDRHGSFEKYVAAKREIVHELERSSKRPRTLVTNVDIVETKKFFDAAVENKISFSNSELTTAPTVPVVGDFNRLNALAALKVAVALGVPESVGRDALKSLPVVRGRVERIDVGQNFTAVVDYAHTPDSLSALYSAFPGRKICVLGNTGGGRDAWKRPQMGQIADESCDMVILTNEDPYDEDPRAIVDAMARGMARAPEIIMDRREAIAHALALAGHGDAVLITGKGTDPYIMGPKGMKEPWDDATVVREELYNLLGTRN